MEVILLERVEKLGQMGDTVKVKPGYARNYLLPQGKALRATKANLSHFEQQRAQLEADNLKRRQEAEAVASKMAGLSVIMVRQAGEAGQLYGSVSARDISDGVTAAGFTIGRQQVLLDRPIKAVGLMLVRVALHPEVSVDVTVNVARSADEAKIQAETGEAVVSMEEREARQEAAQAEAQAAADAAAYAAAEAAVDDTPEETEPTA